MYSTHLTLGDMGRAGVVSGWRPERPFEGGYAGVTRVWQVLSHSGLWELPFGWSLTPEPICGFTLAGPALPCPVQYSSTRPGQPLRPNGRARSTAAVMSVRAGWCSHCPRRHVFLGHCVHMRIPHPTAICVDALGVYVYISVNACVFCWLLCLVCSS